MNTFGSRLRNIRRDRNMSQSDLSEATGLTQPWISDIERDKARPSFDAIQRIAVALNTPLTVYPDDAPQESTTEPESDPCPYCEHTIYHNTRCDGCGLTRPQAERIHRRHQELQERYADQMEQEPFDPIGAAEDS